MLASIDGSDQSRIYYRPDVRRPIIDAARISIDGTVRRHDVHTPPGRAEGEPLELRVLDMSVPESFANDRSCLATWAEPPPDDGLHATAAVGARADASLVARRMSGIPTGRVARA